MAKTYYVDEAFVARIKEMERRLAASEQWQRGFTVTGAQRFANPPTGASIAIATPKHECRRPESELRKALVTEHLGSGRYKGSIVDAGQVRTETPENEAGDDFAASDIGAVSAPPTECRVWSTSPASLSVGDAVWGWLIGFTDPDGFPIVFAASDPQRTFPARIVQSGGEAGDDGERATFTYDVYPLTGGSDPIAEGVSVALSERKIPAEMEPAPDNSYADVLIVSPGSYLITRCDEVYVTKQCDNEESDAIDGGTP